MSKRRDALRTVVEGLRSTRFTLETSCAAALAIRLSDHTRTRQVEDLAVADRLLDVASLQLEDIKTTLKLPELGAGDHGAEKEIVVDPSALVESGPERAWEIDRLGSPDGRPRTSPKNGSVASDFLLRARAREAFELIDLNGNGSLDTSEILQALRSIAAEGGTGGKAINRLLEKGNEDELLDDVNKMMKAVDKDGDGSVDLDEFIQMIYVELEKRKGGDEDEDPGHSRTSSLIVGVTGAAGSKPALGGRAQGTAKMQTRMSMLARSVLIAHKKKSEHRTIGGRNGHFVIHPFSSGHNVWDLMTTGLIVLTVLIIPLALAWDQINDSLFVVNLFIDFIFCADIVKNFYTGYINENDVIVLDRTRIARHYLSSWFVMDLCSSFPLDLVLKIMGREQTAQDAGGAVVQASGTFKALRLVRVAKMFRLLRVSKVYVYSMKLMRHMEDKYKIHVSDTAIKILRLFFLLFLLAHWIGCLSFMLCSSYNFPQESWVVYADLVHVAKRKDLDDERWILDDDEQDEFSNRVVIWEAPIVTQYFWSLFKALCAMLMLGFEGPPITNVTCETRTSWCTIEHWTTLICLWVGAIFYALLVSNMTSIITSMSMAHRRFQEKVDAVTEYMRARKLPSDLREKVREFYTLKYAEGKMFDEATIFRELTPSLRQEVKVYETRDLLKKVPMLTSSPTEVSAKICTYVIPVITFLDETLMYEGHQGDSLFFVNSGLIEIKSKYSEHLYHSIGDGCYFGDVAIFCCCKRTATCRAKSQCHLYEITGGALRDVLEDFPEVFDYMHLIAQRRRKRIEALNPAMDIHDDDDIFEEMFDEEDLRTDLFQETTKNTVHIKKALAQAVHPKRQSIVQRTSMLVRPSLVPAPAPQAAGPEPGGRRQRTSMFAAPPPPPPDEKKQEKTIEHENHVREVARNTQRIRMERRTLRRTLRQNAQPPDPVPVMGQKAFPSSDSSCD